MPSVCALDGCPPVGIIETALGTENPEPARHLNNLTRVYLEQRRWADAEAVARRVLAREPALGPDHPEIGAGCELLGRALVQLGRHSEAEPLLRRALAVHRASAGAEHPDTRELREMIDRLTRERQGA